MRVARETGLVATSVEATPERRRLVGIGRGEGLVWVEGSVARPAFPRPRPRPRPRKTVSPAGSRGRRSRGARRGRNARTARGDKPPRFFARRFFRRRRRAGAVVFSPETFQTVSRTRRPRATTRAFGSTDLRRSMPSRFEGRGGPCAARRFANPGARAAKASPRAGKTDRPAGTRGGARAAARSRSGARGGGSATREGSTRGHGARARASASPASASAVFRRGPAPPSWSGTAGTAEGPGEDGTAGAALC
jgi:hypothetical protein